MLLGSPELTVDGVETANERGELVAAGDQLEARVIER